MKTSRWILVAAAALALIGTQASPSAQQTGGAARPPAAPAAPAAPANDDTKTGLRLELVAGSKASYRVQEQFAGISFPSDAVGSTTDFTGVLVIKPDGTIDSAQSKFTVDLRTLKSDQDQRDGFIRGPRGLNTEKFPTTEFVPRRAVGMPWPFPSQPPAQAGFQLVGDMSAYGTTSEVTWTVVATFNPQLVAGRALTALTFTQFGIPKPQLARLLSVGDNINMELEVRFKRTPM